MGETIDYEKALLDPASVFATPEEVLERTALTKDQKIEILRRWEYDASEVAVAEEEGMVADRRHTVLRRPQYFLGRQSELLSPHKPGFIWGM